MVHSLSSARKWTKPIRSLAHPRADARGAREFSVRTKPSRHDFDAPEGFTKQTLATGKFFAYIRTNGFAAKAGGSPMFKKILVFAVFAGIAVLMYSVVMDPTDNNPIVMAFSSLKDTVNRGLTIFSR